MSLGSAEASRRASTRSTFATRSGRILLRSPRSKSRCSPRCLNFVIMQRRKMYTDKCHLSMLYWVARFEFRPPVAPADHGSAHPPPRPLRHHPPPPPRKPTLTLARQPVLLAHKPAAAPGNQPRSMTSHKHSGGVHERTRTAWSDRGGQGRQALAPRFHQPMMALGLTAPMATQMLVYSGAAHAQAKLADYKPTKRGGGGPLKMLWWQGATLLNPHFAIGTKDQDGSRIFYEPLAAWDPDGDLYPMLAAEIPSRENGGLAKDGKSVTWKLKQGVTWHDGKPFTADDVVFNWEYATDPATAATTIGSYKDVKVEKVDEPHGARAVRQADAVLGRRLRRRARHDHPEAPVRGLQGRQVARRAGQPEAGRHRPLQVRRLQAGRHGARRDQPELPHAEPAVLRHDRDEGRRRRGLGRARRAADRRIRLRLEHAGRGRDPAAPGDGRQGQGRHDHRRRQHRAHPAQHRPTRGPRSTASARA